MAFKKGAKMSKEITLSSALQIFYTVFLGIIIALFFGLGVGAFYEAPKAPTYPIYTEANKEGVTSETAEDKASRIKFETDQRKYEQDLKPYSRNVSMITMVLAVITLVTALFIVHKVFIISDGLLLGAVFTLGYSIIRGMMTEDVKFRFMIAAVGLVITIAVGYFKFIKPKQEK